MTNPINLIVQSGVLPYKYDDDNVLKIMLVTTTSGDEWIIPKGKIEPDLTPAESALKEAREEAGLKGEIVGDVIGSYRFRKKKNNRVCRVDVFPMAVRKKQKKKKWEEKKKRKRGWYTIPEALELIVNPELKELIANAAPLLPVHIENEQD